MRKRTYFWSILLSVGLLLVLRASCDTRRKVTDFSRIRNGMSLREVSAVFPYDMLISWEVTAMPQAEEFFGGASLNEFSGHVYLLDQLQPEYAKQRGIEIKDGLVIGSDFMAEWPVELRAYIGKGASLKDLLPKATRFDLRVGPGDDADFPRIMGNYKWRALMGSFTGRLWNMDLFDSPVARIDYTIWLTHGKVTDKHIQLSDE